MTTVTHTCGHELAYPIRDTPKGRAYESKLRNAPCRPCSNATHSDNARAIADQLQLPVLTGSEAQVRWAIVLRETFRQGLQTAVDQYHGDERTVAMAAEDALLYGCVKSTFWINHKRTDVYDLLDEMMPVARVLLAQKAA